ncbi:MAG: hypothetical protein HY013_07340 [Candidatus Solibacter usitatus]|nr:hypothetical protein [Candidatus Solibacter usitatus]
MRERILVWTAVCLLTALTYYQFPGHTYLQSDTQIYVPILEHFWDPGVLGKDLIVETPHVSYTIYDEAALALRTLTGWGFEQILTLQQVVFRALGIWGWYLTAAAFGLPVGPSLLVAAILSLGATIGGPSVLSIEYEPVPRGFAVPLVFLGIGLAAQGRYLTAGAAGGAAFLYHPPTAYPFWAVYLFFARRRVRASLPLLGAAAMLFVLSMVQKGVTEPQLFFVRIDPQWEALQRMRAAYNWISIWGPNWLAHYAVLTALTALAVARLWKEMPPDLRIFAAGLPAIGALSVPASYLLLEEAKWALTPQAQPMRALLFLTGMAVLLAAVAACRAARAGRWWEALPWFALAYVIPANVRLWPLPASPRIWVVLGLSALACLAVWAEKRGQRWALIPAALAAFFVIPSYGNVRNYPALRTPELVELAQWARTSTPKEAVFLLADADRDLDAGIFRALSLRTVFVDWKGGGQVNYFRSLGEDWWRRWQWAMAKPLDRPDRYAPMGIAFVVRSPKRQAADRPALFRNAKFVVYSTKR